MMATVLRLDATLHAELSADIQKELNMELNRLRAGQRIKDAESAKVHSDRKSYQPSYFHDNLSRSEASIGCDKLLINDDETCVPNSIEID